MAGRIREDSIAEVREKARIDEVVSSYVSLRNAGGGSQKGLCPFHDEKSPSFHVTPSRGFYHCLAAETRVLTWDGVRPISELAGGTHKVLGAGGDWTDAPFRSYGVQRLHRIVLTRRRQQKEIHATDGHRWFVRAGLEDGARREVTTSRLEPGDRLVTSVPRDGTGGTGGAGGPGRSEQDWVVRSVEATDRVEEVFCAEVEDGHAFTLEDDILTGNCFGCGEGGDVITFVMKLDALSFGEAVERLADKYGVQLRREDGDVRDDRPKGPQRSRLIEAHREAQEFYAGQLATPEALAARQFLAERGFDQAAAEQFGVGFAPRDGDALFKHLRAKAFSQEELVTAGLVAVGRSTYDRFRGRLLWPIRDAGGETIGFGARRIFDDDRIDAKYLNTAETPIYKKSQVLYGLDLARREIARSSQAVIVEGYTDVMAAHLAGVGTAVATCGTAFGDEHARVLRRFLNDHEEFRGEVIFTFDGDAAGQKAALRAFGGDQNFVSQTYVAVEPSGLDPCDLRIQQGDAAVRELVARRVPLYRFVLSNVVGKFDLDRADGRIDAVREAARLVASIRDQSKVTAFAQEISKMVGADIDTNQVLAEVRRAASRGPGRDERRPDRRPDRQPGAADSAPAAPPRRAVPDLRDPRFSIERETLKLVIQHPMTIGRITGDVGVNDFTHPTYRGVWELVAAAGGPGAGAGDPAWANRLRDAATDPAVSSAISALGVEPLLTAKEPDASYVALHVFRLLELTTMRRIAELKSRLQRTNPVEHPTEYNRMFGELAALEQHRRTLRERTVSAQ
ncbi:DNA primase [Nocardioides panaciterrulae]|uniref:DNA primase n=1 Tax=Nocardioides panaciterrulae TaxID=661492 RepID=A0A7Y9JAR6_9ACTN|nr:DNA primase [Nocardioides panaciterrulae]